MIRVPPARLRASPVEVTLTSILSPMFAVGGRVGGDQDHGDVAALDLFLRHRQVELREHVGHGLAGGLVARLSPEPARPVTMP